MDIKFNKDIYSENYKETKNIYWDLILFYLKQPQNDRVKKIIEDLKNGWKEWEKKDFEDYKKLFNL